jgi:hypothetical protein
MLNEYAGKELTEVEAVVAMPQELWVAVVHFTAYQIYIVNGLGLLDSYSSNATSVWNNLAEDNTFGATALVAPVPAREGILSSICYWLPKDAGGKVLSDYKKATRGTLFLVDNTGVQHLIPTRIVSSTNGRQMLVVDRPAPAQPSIMYEGDDVVI